MNGIRRNNRRKTSPAELAGVTNGDDPSGNLDHNPIYLGFLQIRRTQSQARIKTIDTQEQDVGAQVMQCFFDDLKKIDVPTLVMHGEDDQIVPVKDSAKKSAKLIKGAKEIYYPGAPHGLTATHQDQINADLLAFIAGKERRKAA